MKKYMFFLFILLFPINTFAFNDTAKSTVVIDINSGRILYQKNANEKRLIASTTKLMTTVVALENYNINKMLTVGDEIYGLDGTNIYVKKGERISVKDLLYGLNLRSGNDSAAVLSKNIKNDDFVKLMNDTAKKIKMNNTIFLNPHGLDDDTKNYSTAMDMSKLSRYAYNKYPLFREITKTYKYSTKTTDKSYIWYNRNKLLKNYKYCIGGKTGYTPKAGKALISYAKKNDMLLSIVTLKDSNHYTNHKNMYEYFFSKYKNYKIIDKRKFKVDEEYYKDNLYIKKDFYYPLSYDEVDKLDTIVKITKLNKYENNDVVGNIEIKLKNKLIKKINIYVRKNKKKKFFLF